jgi:hypothetical protein
MRTRPRYLQPLGGSYLERFVGGAMGGGNDESAIEIGKLEANPRIMHPTKRPSGDFPSRSVE